MSSSGGSSGGSPAATVTGPDTFGHAAAVGTSTAYARADHDHGLPAAPSYGPAWQGGAELPFLPTQGQGIGTNTVVYMKFRCKESVTVAGLRFIVSNPAGNVDVGIYADSAGVPGARLASAGSVACPAAGGANVAFTAGVALTAGTDYWMALGSSTVTATFGTTPSSNFVGAGIAVLFQTQAVALPLPANATPANLGSATFPVLGYAT